MDYEKFEIGENKDLPVDAGFKKNKLNFDDDMRVRSELQRFFKYFILHVH